MQRLQTEALATVDRFVPAFDTDVEAKFKQVNQAIGQLIKSKDLEKLVLGSPLTEWEDDVLWQDAANTGALRDTRPGWERKQLLRQAVWKFVAERLLDTTQPFCSFGGAVGNLAERWCFDKLFPEPGERRSSDLCTYGLSERGPRRLTRDRPQRGCEQMASAHGPPAVTPS